MTSLSPPPPRHRNGFDILRLGLAVMVVYTHALQNGADGNDWFQIATKHQSNPGSIAVLGFFGLSGYLVSQSFRTAPRWQVFLRHRALRLLPAFYFSLVVSAFVAAPLLAHFQHAPWRPVSAAEFVVRNAALKINRWSVGAETAGLHASLNGALWTLFPEACCYLLVLGLGVTGALSLRRHEVVILAALMFMINTLVAVLQPAPLPLLPSVFALSDYSPLGLAFAVGTLYQCYREHVPLGRGGAIVFGLLTAAALKFGGWQIMGPVLFPIFILHLGHSFQARLSVDLSYGLYLFHFPCQQVLVAAGLGFSHPFSLFFLSLAMSSGWATLSWFAVERPALRRK